VSFCADFYKRIQNVRWIGFQGFILNKAFAVSDAVPVGHVWLIFSLSGFHSVAAARVVHFFAVPPGEAGNLINLSADGVSAHFLGANNNPPLKSGVLMSPGGSSAMPDMQSNNSSSVNGLLYPFYLPERWKILACIDSGEGVTNPTPDGITIDAALIDVAASECLPDL
jgi:hypothetical protein